MLFCPFDIPTTYTGTAFIEGQAINSYEVELVPTGDLNEYTIDNIWGDFVAAAAGDPSLEGEFPYPGTLNIVCTGNATFTGESTSMPGGEGSLNTSTNEINISLEQGVFTQPFMVDVVLTPNPN